MMNPITPIFPKNIIQLAILRRLEWFTIDSASVVVKPVQTIVLIGSGNDFLSAPRRLLPEQLSPARKQVTI